jgi:hypothetical protein
LPSGNPFWVKKENFVLQLDGYAADQTIVVVVSSNQTQYLINDEVFLFDNIH